jgi:hypothetical protein
MHPVGAKARPSGKRFVVRRGAAYPINRMVDDCALTLKIAFEGMG